MALSPPVIKQVQGVMFRILPRLLTVGLDSSVTAFAVANDTVQISDAGGNSVKIQFDPATGLPARLTYQEADETLSDWRDVDVRMILEDLMLDLMYYLPSYKKVREFLVTKEMVMTQKINMALLEKAG